MGGAYGLMFLSPSPTAGSGIKFAKLSLFYIQTGAVCVVYLCSTASALLIQSKANLLSCGELEASSSQSRWREEVDHIFLLELIELVSPELLLSSC